jgi:lysophospholipase L1-like esterase
MRLALVTTSTSAAARAPEAAESGAPDSRGGVLLIGDSLAQGLWPHLGELARANGLPFHFSASQGTSVNDWLVGSRLENAVTAATPALTLVCLGTNDMARRDSGGRAGELLDTIRRAGCAETAWIGPPRVRVDSTRFRATLAAQCAVRGVRIFDSQALELSRAPDEIHMTPAGYRAWAESIASWVPFAALLGGNRPSGREASGSRLPSSRPRSPDEGRTPVDPSMSLGERAARFSLEEQRDGVHEDPPGSNRGPRIDQYHRGLGALGDPWCAWGFCFAAYAVLLPGEALPHDYAGGVATLIRTGRFHQRGDGYVPRLGDGAVWMSNGQDPTQGGQGYIGRLLVGPDEHGRFETIEASADHAWAQRAHDVAEPSFLGWLEYPAGISHVGVALREPFVVAGLGELMLEDYVARVVTGEVGGFVQLEALKAQALAARTFVERALRDDAQLGARDKPVKNGEDFQVAARVATDLAVRAARDTRGGAILHRGKLILANYVAGAPWAPGASRGTRTASHSTERYVTYNAGLRGAAVVPTPLADTRRADNRGCLSQNGARTLALRGWKWPRILRFFYGEDVEFTIGEPADAPSRPQLRTPAPASTKGAPSRRPDDVVPLFAVAALAYRIFG